MVARRVEIDLFEKKEPLVFYLMSKYVKEKKVQSRND